MKLKYNYFIEFIFLNVLRIKLFIFINFMIFL